jgi:hypothetical protein
MSNENYLHKNLVNKEFTSEEKKWYEENSSNLENVNLENIRIDEIPKNPPAITTDIVEIISDLVLTKDQSTENNKAWLTCKTIGVLSSRIYDFIQPTKKLSNKYNIRVYDNIGQQLLIDEIEWSFDYLNGILTFQENPEEIGYEAPFHIYGYRYIGERATKDIFGAQSLDDAYDTKVGDGAGRVINADSGPVSIQASDGSSALKIGSIDYIPTEDVSGDEIINYRGILYVYDLSRNIWVSLNRQAVTFGAKRADGIYLNLSSFTSNMSGWPALRNGVILGLTAQASGGTSQKKIEIYRNNSSTPSFQFNLNNLYYANGDLNLQFEKNDLIKILVSSEFGTVYNLIVNLEIGWALFP